MDDNGHAIARQTDIEFDSVGAVKECALECRKRILRRDAGRAAVADDERSWGGTPRRLADTAKAIFAVRLRLFPCLPAVWPFGLPASRLIVHLVR